MGFMIFNGIFMGYIYMYIYIFEWDLNYIKIRRADCSRYPIFKKLGFEHQKLLLSINKLWDCMATATSFVSEATGKLDD